MKLSKIFLLAVLPVIGLTIINTPINQVQQVQATDMACIEACAAIQATGAKACSLA